MSTIDATDSRILSVLQRRGRISNAELADEIHLSASACYRLAQRLRLLGERFRTTGTGRVKLQALWAAEKILALFVIVGNDSTVGESRRVRCIVPIGEQVLP